MQKDKRNLSSLRDGIRSARDSSYPKIEEKLGNLLYPLIVSPLLKWTMNDLSRMHYSRIKIRISQGIVCLFIVSLSLILQAHAFAAQKQKLEKSYKEWLERD